jgi:hypothetical protein
MSEIGVCCVSSHHPVSVKIICDFAYRVFHRAYPTVVLLVESWKVDHVEEAIRRYVEKRQASHVCDSAATGHTENDREGPKT